MLKKILKKQNEKVVAFTLIETLVALLVVSLMGMVLYFSFFVSVKSVNSSNKNISIQIKRRHKNDLSYDTGAYKGQIQSL